VTIPRKTCRPMQRALESRPGLGHHTRAALPGRVRVGRAVTLRAGWGVAVPSGAVRAARARAVGDVGFRALGWPGRAVAGGVVLRVPGGAARWLGHGPCWDRAGDARHLEQARRLTPARRVPAMFRGLWRVGRSARCRDPWASRVARPVPGPPASRAGGAPVGRALLAPASGEGEGESGRKRRRPAVPVALGRVESARVLPTGGPRRVRTTTPAPGVYATPRRVRTKRPPPAYRHP
jgi:hypothetical protein